MKPFNLEEALAGKPVVTREGRDVLSITRIPTVAESEYPLIIHVAGDRNTTSSKIDGAYYDAATQSDYDLFMKVVEREVFVNIYDSDGIHGYVHTTEPDADRCATSNRINGKAFRLTWEE